MALQRGACGCHQQLSALVPGPLQALVFPQVGLSPLTYPRLCFVPRVDCRHGCYRLLSWAGLEPFCTKGRGRWSALLPLVLSLPASPTHQTQAAGSPLSFRPLVVQCLLFRLPKVTPQPPPSLSSVVLQELVCLCVFRDLSLSPELPSLLG